VQHAVALHQHQDTRELRQQLKQLFKNGAPSAGCSVNKAWPGIDGKALAQPGEQRIRGRESSNRWLDI